MVTHLNIALDDSAAERVRAVKEDLGLTWAEFVAEAADTLENRGVTNEVPEIAEPENASEIENLRLSPEMHQAQAEMAAERGEEYDPHEFERRIEERRDEAPHPVDDSVPVEGKEMHAAEWKGLDSEVAELDLPGSGDSLEKRRIAVQTLYNHLKRKGTARRRDFLELVDADAVGYSSVESFWSNCIKGSNSLQSLPGVDPPGEGEHVWRYES